MSGLNNPNAVLKNLIYVAEQFSAGQFIAITFFDHDAKEVISLLHVRQESLNQLSETVSDLTTMIKGVYASHGDGIGGIALVVLNHEGEQASEVGNALAYHSMFDEYPIFAVLFTDGFRWREVFENIGGEVDHAEITEFQLRSIVDGDNITVYNPQA